MSYSRSAGPECKGTNAGDAGKVPIGREHRELVADTQLCEKRVDRADLNSAAPARGSEVGCVDVVSPIGHHERQSGKALHDALAGFRPGEALKQLLKDEAGRGIFDD